MILAADGENPLRQMLEWMVQQALELEMNGHLGAQSYERSDERLGYRNGHRPRVFTTAVGDLDLLIPQDHKHFRLPIERLEKEVESTCTHQCPKVEKKWKVPVPRRRAASLKGAALSNSISCLFRTRRAGSGRPRRAARAAPPRSACVSPRRPCPPAARSR